MAVSVKRLINDFDLEVLVEGNEDIKIEVNDVNRPGLQLAGFYNYFAPERIQIIGKAEWSFLQDMQIEVRKKRVKKYLSFNITCLIISRDLEPHEEFIKEARKNNIWVLRSKSVTTKLISKITLYLADKLAPETRLHGVLVDVSGIGILITGESGIGKSETALELIKRGHRLITDDAVDIRESDGTLIGSSPKITIGMLEVRGIGIIDVTQLYGLSSVLEEKEIKLIMHFEHWKDDNDYDRLGIDNQYMDILGIPVKKLTVPVRPGRNIAVIIEAAAVNYRYSLMSKISPVDIIENRMSAVSDEA
ncbi:HPr kinase/phosphorylase [Clostridium botulinum]|uniref:HPr kinase/phosphorylase n=1 Tax=Clostridium botulinum (strain Eklund 17B / Type B) TaxID=935198 RepID=HPRK_CLOBB|nr:MULTISPECIES: HPr(Ser) kinase/phosphatase [Clostridium]B2TP76.1 RecName: Full=HPr kinase/phosphorylase; Short=HPrK/P; AltName: Full=HPr(Ser) kinase/phosphorylase [Clostridium botulinum B str. Eklund 17B (NRP)]AIY79588.1 HPr(Ser) kinase/phosphatase [Clostridium botulinum 202F]KAI3347898.1 HPr(Ser) kinase/phosphatase [Clostridium botulinum]ACD22711.1 HPr(Ser) kinase/phosphatase [Clostridium botulinum B str. Eklund 17B (NRP)]KFX53897.1 serine kinase [Clostridium botulinum]KFX57113.1 serine ki